MADATAPILVGVDGSPSSILALRHAAGLAQALDRPIEVVTTWEFPVMTEPYYPLTAWSPEEDAKAILARALEEAFPEGRPENLTGGVMPGPAANALIQRSSDASMLVVGSRGRGGFAGLVLGSVSTACAQHAHCPVLIVRPDSKSKDDAASS